VSAAKICKGRCVYRATIATVLSKRRLEVSTMEIAGAGDMDGKPKRVRE
jgi:hypothetical protein